MACSPEVIDVLEQSASALGLNAHQMVSGAGHDAMVIADIAKMGMVFVRSQDGISHNPKEWSSQEDCAAGVNMLLQAAIRLAQ